MTTVAAVNLWGRRIGAVSQEDDRDYAEFEYDPTFSTSGIEVAPLMMPLRSGVFSFPELARETFSGLPGLLADSLPDKFGNAVINAWLATQGRLDQSFNAIERLCYTGTRGMGALEFLPATGPKPDRSARVRVDALVELAGEILRNRDRMKVSFGDDRKEALTQILRVGTSAGGARAKAVIAWNPQTNEVRSGQIAAGSGFEHWLLKFDGVRGNRDKELEDPTGYGAIEYAYYLMATEAGVSMNECRMFEEHDRRHFMTKRFDRQSDGKKLHMQSLGALGHYDFNQAGSTSYEQALQVIRRLDLPVASVEQGFRRMVFNVVARNQDDHVKNIAFLMDKSGQWHLAPAFDVTYSYNPGGIWTHRHQMSINGKRHGFTMADLKACAKSALLKRGRAQAIFEEVRAVVSRWSEFAERASVLEEQREPIERTHRLNIPKV